MLKNTTRRLVAVMLAVLVICSFAGAPTIAAAGSDDSLGDDVSSVGSGDSTGDSDSSDDSTDDGSDDSTNDSTDSTDDSTDKGDSSDEDTSSNEGDSTDEDDSSDEGDSTDDGNSSDDGDDTEEVLTEVVDETANVAAYRTFEIAESVTKTTDIDGRDISYDGGETGSSTESSTASEEQFSPREFRAASSDRTTDARSNRRAVAAVAPGSTGEVTLSTGTGGGQPVPTGESGGAALGLGAVAAAAVVRSAPLFAGSTSSSTGTAVSGYLSSLLDKVKPFVFPLRYSRYDDSDPLEHDAREQVYEIVNETPGSYLSEVSERAGLPLSTTRHHMKVLEREDLVSGAKLRGKRRFYPAYAKGIELAAALNDDSTASIIDALARLGAASVSDLAGELDRDPSTISHHLQRLEEDDIIAREREGRAVMNKLSAEARTALEPESAPRPGEAGEAVAD